MSPRKLPPISIPGACRRPLAPAGLALLATLITLVPAAAAGPSSSSADVAAAAATDWSQWRGPHRDGIVEGPAWPDDLERLEPIWRLELGKSYSGPIVTDDTVFVTEAIDGETEGARALDRATGDERWRVQWSGSGKVPFFARSNGDWIRSTPAWDGEALYVGGMEEVLLKLDGATGEILWRVDFPERFGLAVPDFGFASSPLLDGDHLYVQAASSIVKLRRDTGETVWRALDEDTTIMSSGAFSSPLLAEVGGRRQLLVLTRKALFGLDPESGATLWQQEVPHFRGMHILTPVVWRDRVFTSPYKERSFLFSVEERDGRFQTSELWNNKASGYMSSPVIVGDHLYLHLGNERVVCIDLTTGETRWTSTPMGKYWSMVAQGDKILGLDSGGELHLLQATPEEPRILASREIASAETWGHLAVSGDQLFVRELEAIAVWRWTR